jgi:pimeloyl-ACP methyl ester carboxylesterase
VGADVVHKKAIAQSSNRPYVVFVNGQGNCCAWGMNSLQNKLMNEMNAEIRYVPYSNFRDGGQSGGGNKFDWTSVDTQFLRDGEDFINNRLDKNRPLILIGHSYGGDSILSLLPRINRRIQFVGVIDPVSAGGLRSTLTRFTIPDKVDYFYNRWQENEPFPNDYIVNGSIRCNARKCDQDKQSFVVHADGNVHRENCKWFETCSRKNRRVSHQELAKDEWIQRIIGDKIQEQITAFKPSTLGVIPEGNFHTKGTVYYSNGRNAYCGFTSPLHYRLSSSRKWGDWREISDLAPYSSMRNDGICKVIIPEGNFHHKGTVYYSNGQGAYCGFTSPEHYRQKSGQPWGKWLEVNEPVPFQQFMRYDGPC